VKFVPLIKIFINCPYLYLKKWGSTQSQCRQVFRRFATLCIESN